MNPLQTLPAPPQWSLLVGDLGRILVVASVVGFVLCVVAGCAFPRSKAATVLLVGSSVALFGAFLALSGLFAANRMEFAYVWGHSDSQTPLVYRLSGVWAGQEGSFLLWAVCAAIFGLATVGGAGAYRRWYIVVFAALLACLSGILAYETPFGLNLSGGHPVVPPEGTGLNPALLNYWMVVHPPVIFLGFGALTVPFAYAVAALATGDTDAWVRLVRPWALIAMSLVGLGLCMGGFWAYETLGWGGFWMWDPVENASFVPWMFAAALVHGLPVQVVKSRWRMSNLMLASLPFLAFVYGTFLTRSGYLAQTSVHSFAEMDRIALKILLALLVGSLAAFFGLWFWRLPAALKPAASATDEPGVHREGFLRWGSFLLFVLGLGALIGMSVPAVQAIRGVESGQVGERVYHWILVWVFAPLMLVLAAAPFVNWRSLPARQMFAKVYNSFCISVGLVGVTMLLLTATRLGAMLDLSGVLVQVWVFRVTVLGWVLFLIGLCSFVAVSSLWMGLPQIRKAPGLAMAPLSHLGVAMLMAGLILSRGFENKTMVAVQEGSPAEALGMKIDFKGQTSTREDRNNKVLFEVTGAGGQFTARPGLYYHTNPDGMESAVATPSIKRCPLHDVYLALQAPEIYAAEAIKLTPGQSTDMNGYGITFKQLVPPGTAPVSKSEIGARLVIATHMRTFAITPRIDMAGGHMHPVPAAMGKQYEIELQDIDISTSTITLRVRYAKPVYPIEVFVKPMTILVWLGTAVVTLAGFLAAWFRWRERG